MHELEGVQVALKSKHGGTDRYKHTSKYTGDAACSGEALEPDWLIGPELIPVSVV